MSVGASVFYEGAAEFATLTNTFSVDDVPTDPTTVSLSITTPAGVVTPYTYPDDIDKTSTGVYTMDAACTEDGVWKYVWTGTGTAADIIAGTWTVFTSELQKLYCTVDELKSRVGISLSDTTDDFEIRLAIDTASREIDDWCQDQFWRGTATRTFTADCAYTLDLGPFPLVSVTTIKTDSAGDGTFENTWDAADYQLLPLNVTTLAEPKPYRQVKAVASNTFPYWRDTARDDRVEIVGVYGWPQVPSAVKHAALIHAEELLKLKDAPFGVGGFGEFGPVRVRMNSRAMSLLNPYRRFTFLVA